ncbi:50S ribosomal protein L24 [Candidatus Woesearchaeota archaeon]|nr:50S ribosomal protein L24 [Candidatus Woesearchaeota archaeon]
MKRTFSQSWKASKKPSKQRKYRYNSPLHTKRKLLSAHLSKQLKEKHKKRALEIRKGDTAKVMRGQFRGKTGRIEKASIKLGSVYLSGIETQRKDGTKALYPIDPSNIMLTELNQEDKRRMKVRIK